MFDNKNLISISLKHKIDNDRFEKQKDLFLKEIKKKQKYVDINLFKNYSNVPSRNVERGLKTEESLGDKHSWLNKITNNVKIIGQKVNSYNTFDLGFYDRIKVLDIMYDKLEKDQRKTKLMGKNFQNSYSKLLIDYTNAI